MIGKFFITNYSVLNKQNELWTNYKSDQSSMGQYLYEVKPQIIKVQSFYDNTDTISKSFVTHTLVIK